jgi:hypothetical protein
MIAASVLLGIVSGIIGMTIAFVSGMGIFASLLIYPASGLLGMLLTIMLATLSRQIILPTLKKVSRALS